MWRLSIDAVGYDTTPSPGDLNAWDAATLYLSLDGRAGASLGWKAIVWSAKSNWWEEPRTQWQTAFRYDGTAWASVNLPSTTSSGWRGDAPNSDEDDRGWNLSFIVPFSNLGLPSPPAPGTVWRMAVVLHDRDDAAGTPIPDKTWPENVAADRPATWGQLSFGQPTYEPPAATAEGSVTKRHRSNGSAVPDAAVGGAAVCGAGTDSGRSGARQTRPFTALRERDSNVQNQEDVADWPCFSKYYVTFPHPGGLADR